MDTNRLDLIDFKIVLATQAGLPLTSAPYETLATQLSLSEDEVISRLRRLLELGAVRRIGVVPNHYALGLVANGMSVWDVDDQYVDAVGALVGGMPGITHCYRRPRQLPLWPYNLFAMLHARDRADVQRQLIEVRRKVDCQFKGAIRTYDVLFSTQVLKKTGVRFKGAV